MIVTHPKTPSHIQNARFVVTFFLLIATVRHGFSDAATELISSSPFRSEADVRDSKLNIRLTYEGETPIEVYDPTLSFIRVLSAGKWVAHARSELITGPGILSTTVLNKGETLRASFELPKLFDSAKPGPNEFIVKILVVSTEQKRIEIRQTVQANLTAEQIASVWPTSPASDKR